MFSLLFGAVLLALTFYGMTNRWSWHQDSEPNTVRRLRLSELIAKDCRQWSALRQLFSRCG